MLISGVYLGANPVFRSAHKNGPASSIPQDSCCFSSLKINTLPLINWNCSHPDIFLFESTNNPPVMPWDPENKPIQRDRMTLIVFSSPDVSYCISMFAYSIPAHHPSGAVRFLGVALSFPRTYSAAWVLFQAIACPSIIPSSWTRDMCGYEPRLTDVCSAREMEPIHRACKMGETQTARSVLLNHSHWSGLLHRENLSGSIRSLLGLDFICFS